MKLRRYLIFGWIFILVVSICSPLLPQRAEAANTPYVGAQYVKSGGTITLTQDSWDKFSDTAKKQSSYTFTQKGTSNTYVGNNNGSEGGGGVGCLPYDWVTVNGNQVLYSRRIVRSAGTEGQAPICGMKYTKQAGKLVTNGTPAKASSNQDPEIVACESSNAPMAWAWCPVIKVLNGLVNGLYGYAISHLQFSLYKPVTGDDIGVGGLSQSSYDNVKASWQVMARLATSLLVVVFLVMIIAQASANLLDAYTVKKLLPRIVIAFILINLSWYLVSVAIEIGNIVGGGIRDILLAPFTSGHKDVVAMITPNDQTSIEVGAGVLGTAIVGIFVLIATPGIGMYLVYLVLPILISLLASVLIGMVVIILRQGILILLAVTAPIAILLWVMPGTKQYFDKWKDTLITMILFFPIFQAIITIGAILAIVTQATVS